MNPDMEYRISPTDDSDVEWRVKDGTWSIYQKCANAQKAIECAAHMYQRVAENYQPILYPSKPRKIYGKDVVAFVYKYSNPKFLANTFDEPDKEAYWLSRAHHDFIAYGQVWIGKTHSLNGEDVMFCARKETDDTAHRDTTNVHEPL